MLFGKRSCIIAGSDIPGCGPAGRAPGLGPGCREFESRHSDQKSKIRLCGFWTFLFVWSETRTIKCDSPVDCCRRRLDGGELLSAQSADANESRHSISICPAYQEYEEGVLDATYIPPKPCLDTPSLRRNLRWVVQGRNNYRQGHPVVLFVFGLLLCSGHKIPGTVFSHLDRSVDENVCSFCNVCFPFLSPHIHYRVYYSKSQ